MSEEFSRTEMLLGSDAMKTLAAARVAVFGIGGVGGYVVEALARSGIGALDLVDSDIFCVSNINRQIYATRKTLGCAKVDVAAERIGDINPECRVVKKKTFFLPSNTDEFDFSQYDYVVDAIDTVSWKLALIQKAKESNVPVISAMGAGNKLDPTAFKVADIYETSVCPLARVMRRELRKMGIDSLKVVYSQEEPREHTDESPSSLCDIAQKEREKAVPGSTAFVPPVMGLIIAGEVIKDLTGFTRKE